MMTIPLTQGQVARVDDADYPALSVFKWQARWEPTANTFYASRNERTGHPHPSQRTIRMHAQITGWALTDHIDHDGLNNQRENLRQASKTTNGQNRQKQRKATTSRYKGVSRFRAGWIVSIYVNGKSKHLGTYADEQDAARAYNAAALAHFGEFAYVNDLSA